MGPSFIPQPNGGALLSGGKPGHPGHNQHTVGRQAQAVRGELIAELEGAAKDLSALLETARESDRGRGAPTAAVFTGVWRARRGMKG